MFYKKHGYGELVWPNGSRYVGNWKDDKPEGKGKQFHENGDYYEGEFSDGK